MSLLEELNNLVTACGLPVETGIFSGAATDAYVVITPLSDIFEVFADNSPQAEVQEARLSLFVKGSYTKQKNALGRALLDADFTVTDRRFIEYETDTKYYHYAIDVAHFIKLE